MVRFLVEHGACVFATTFSDHETAAEKCEEDEEGFIGCSEYLYSIQEKLGIMNNGEVFAVYEYASNESDELNLEVGDAMAVLKKGDENEKDWWWAKRIHGAKQEEGYIPKNLLGLFARVQPGSMVTSSDKDEDTERKEDSSESSSSSGSEEQTGGQQQHHHQHMEDHHANNGSSSA